jgi:choice-of-anchor C domain-containing protein
MIKFAPALFSVIVAGAFSSSGQTVHWQQPTATYSQPNYSVADAVDLSSATGWGVAHLDGTTTAETAVFETTEDVATGPEISLTFRLTSGGFPGANLGRYRISVTGDDRSQFADGLANGGDVTANWEVLEPLSFHTVGGATLTKLEDNSILASGPNPNFDTNVVVARTSLARITGVRIETMLDTNLPTSGPGRHANGNFVLYDINVTAERLQQPTGLAFDIKDSFSATNNPNPPWGYGWAATIGGAFTPLNSVSSTAADGGVTLPFWQLAGVTLPSVYKNVSSQTISVGGGVASYPPGTVWFFAGLEGRQENYGVIRFTVPAGAAGNYSVQADVAPVYPNSSQGDTDFYVVRNGQEVFGQFLAPTSSTSYSNVVTLEEGGTIEFLVGRGADNRVSGSGLRIAATLTQVTNAPPEPPQPTNLVFNVRDSFSTTNNPNPPWAYGWTGTIGGSFIPLNSVSSTTADGGVTLPFWQLADVTLPSVYKNVSSQTISVGGGSASFPPGTVWFYAGLEGRQENYGVIRFTLPAGAAGNYSVQADVAPVYPNSSQGDADFHIVRNGQELFGQFLAPSSSTSYSNLLTLEDGGTIDFVVGRGADNRVSGSGLRIAATLTQVTNAPPEPPQPTNQFLVNGSFELGSNPGISSLLNAPDNTTIIGWTLESGSIDYIGSRWVAQDGQRCLDMSGISPGTISQLLQGLESGHWYRLSFAMAGNPELLGTLPVVKRLQARVGALSREYAFDASGTTSNDLRWSTKTLDFQATASSVTLSFVSLTPGLGGAALDQVVIVPIDEPPQPPQGPTYVLSDGFSAVDNPNGAWAYGWAATVGGTFTTLTTASTTTADGGVTLPFWEPTGFTLPSVYKNVENQTISVGGGAASFPPGTLWFFAGAEGRPEAYGVIRFTLPTGAAGHYAVHANVAPVYPASPQGDTDFHIVHDGRELFGRFLAPAETASYSNVVTFGEGGTLDFVIGRGADGRVSGSGLRIAATLTLVTNAPPEPPTGLVANGSFELGANPGISTMLAAPQSTIIGWTLESGTIDYIGTRWVAQDGERCLDMSGVNPGTISQMLHGLQTGQWYRLSFGMAGNPELLGSLPVVKRLRATLGDVSEDFAFDATGATVDNLGWTTKTFDFQATATAQKLSFVSLTDGIGGAALDNVVIQPIDPPQPPITAGAYDLSRDFSLAANPNGVWSYGGKLALTTPLELMRLKGVVPDDHGLPVEYWQLVPGIEPTVYHNSNSVAAISNGGQGVHAPGSVWYFPGIEGRSDNYGVIRFTAPSNAIFRVRTSVKSYLNGPLSGDTDFHVLFNNAELFGQFLPSLGSTAYSNELEMVQGDTLDFIVGRGADNNNYASGLDIKATIVPAGTPEPPANHPPVASNQSQRVLANTTTPIQLVASDPDGDSLTYQVSAPQHGTVTGTGPLVSYRPQQNFRGHDSFTFRVSDGRGGDATATVSLQVIGSSNSPVPRIVLQPRFELAADQVRHLVIAHNRSNALVTLDGSLSSDADEDPLEFGWWLSSQLIGAKAVITNRFELGTHEVRLTVGDLDVTSTETELFDVITPAEAAEELLARIDEMGLSHRQKRPLIVTLRATATALERHESEVALIHLQALKAKIRSQLQRTAPDTCESLCAMTDRLIQALSTSLD